MSEKNKHREKNETKVLGMELGHLVEDAEKWWKEVGMDRMRNRNFSESTQVQQDALNATNPVHPNFIGGKSGILLGYSWDMLTPPERYRVIKAYTLTLSGSTIKIAGE